MSDGVAIGIGSMVVAIFTLIWNVLEKRDKLKYDVKLAVLEAKQAMCEQNDAAKGLRIATLEAHIVTLTAADVKDKAEVLAKIHELHPGDKTPDPPVM